MKIRIGFVPTHREPFDENWAIEMRKRTISALSKNSNLEIVVPNNEITQNGLLRNDTDAEKIVRLFRNKEVDPKAPFMDVEGGIPVIPSSILDQSLLPLTFCL